MSTPTPPRFRRRLAIPMLAALALPWLAAAPPLRAEEPAAPSAVDQCVQMRERIFECKDEFAEAFVDHHNPPGAQRAAMKQQALEEIVADGSGPLEGRRQACTKTVQHGPPISPDKLSALSQGLARCVAVPNCKARVDCLMPLIKPMVGKGKSVKH